MKNHPLLKKIYEDGGIGPRSSVGITSAEIDLVLAYFRGEVENKDLVRVYGASGAGPAAYRVTRALRDLIIDGDLIELVDKRGDTR